VRAPLTFLYAFLTAPLNLLRTMPKLTPTHPPTLLGALFLIHYANRAVLSPLRTPSRTKTGIIVTLAGVFFNIVNGTLIGAYLSSGQAARYLSTAWSNPTFYVGIALWALGFVGNIVHDEILFDIRRDATRKRKEAEAAGKKEGTDSTPQKGEYYGIPHGYLYSLISYPNYFCEWLEWLGFALAASPLPPSLNEFTRASPPWLFFAAEVFVMLPRAYRGHLWYLKKFPDYPKNRKAVIPYIF